jgi:hypothetical protein
MSRRLSVLISIFILLLSGLACNLPAVTMPSQISVVNVSPSAGSGEFSVSEGYHWDLADPNFSIVCTFPSESGFPTKDAVPLTQKGIVSTFTISVTKPGKYSINCTDSLNHSASAVFTVTGAADATDEPANPSNSQVTPTVTATNATIDFYGSGLKYNTPPLGDPNDWLKGYCWPPQDLEKNGKSYFNIELDGSLMGRCSVDTKDVHILGQLSGHYYGSTGEVNFRLEASHVFKPDDINWNEALVVLEGKGKREGDSASGTASFTVTCDAHGDIDCVHDTGFQDLKYQGTIPFTITFLP